MAIELLLKDFTKQEHSHKDFSGAINKFTEIVSLEHDHGTQIEKYVFSSLLLKISKVLFYLRFSYIQRYIRVNRCYKELFETNVTDMTIKTKLLILI